MMMILLLLLLELTQNKAASPLDVDSMLIHIKAMPFLVASNSDGFPSNVPATRSDALVADGDGLQPVKRFRNEMHVL